MFLFPVLYYNYFYLFYKTQMSVLLINHILVIDMERTVMSYKQLTIYLEMYIFIYAQ